MADIMASEHSSGNGAAGPNVSLCDLHEERLDGQHVALSAMREQTGKLEVAVTELRESFKGLRWQLALVVFVAMAGGTWAGDVLKTLLPLGAP